MNTTTKEKRASKKSGRYHSGGTLPVDLAILELLPDEGQMLGYMPIALQVSTIKNHPGFESISGGQISGRLKAMSFEGLTVSQVIFPVHKGNGWQRTSKGKELLHKNGKVTV